MRRSLATIAAGAALATALSAQAPRDWTKTVVATPEGGFRMGNPDAPVKLVEYGSLTCSTCARFATEGMPELTDKYVKPGKVSFEFRNYVRDPADMAAALLSRCAAPADFFALTDKYMTTQQRWYGRITTSFPAQRAALEKLPAQQRVARFAVMGGLDAGAAQHGVTPARAKACLADPKGHAALVALVREGNAKHRIKSTPTFLVNGVKAERTFDWAALEPLLAPPGG